jgi:Holliday junction resolvase RusA-like endonuclease
MLSEPNDSDCTAKIQVLSKIIFGEPASKANSRRLVHFGGVSRLIKSKKALSYKDFFLQQWEPITPLMTGDLAITMHIYYASRRPDLDESLILDLMQGVVYENDRQVKERHTYWHLDPESPRTEIEVSCIPDVAPKKKPRKGLAERGKRDSK